VFEKLMVEVQVLRMIIHPFRESTEYTLFQFRREPKENNIYPVGLGDNRISIAMLKTSSS
jgi:hypothetical protein